MPDRAIDSRKRLGLRVGVVGDSALILVTLTPEVALDGYAAMACREATSAHTIEK